MIETYEVTQDILLAITGLGFLCGVLAAVFATRFFEVVHLHRMVDQTVYRLLLMCSKLDEDINFISALKETELQNQNFDENSRRKFRKLDEEVDGAEEVRGLGDVEDGRAAEVGARDRIDVAELHLEVGRTDIPNVSEV